MDDSTLRHLVIDALEKLPLVNAANIGVAVCDGVVALTGHVQRASHKALIEFAVMKLHDMRGLTQDIDVCFDAELLNTDEEIAKRVVRMIGWNTPIPEDALRIRVERGWVTMTGRVASRELADRAAEIAHSARGVVGVSNLLVVLTPPISLAAHRRAKATGQSSGGAGAVTDVLSTATTPCEEDAEQDAV